MEENNTERVKKKHWLHFQTLVHSANIRNFQGWEGLKPGVWNSICLPWGWQSPKHLSHQLLPPRIQRKECVSEAQQPRLQPDLHYGKKAWQGTARHLFQDSSVHESERMCGLHWAYHGHLLPAALAAHIRAPPWVPACLISHSASCWCDLGPLVPMWETRAEFPSSGRALLCFVLL